MGSHEPTLDQTGTPPRCHQHDGNPGHRGLHRLVMAVCCVPMLVLAVVLIVTGVVAPSFLLVAVACMAMMMVMMSAMHRSDSDHGRGRS